MHMSVRVLTSILVGVHLYELKSDRLKGRYFGGVTKSIASSRGTSTRDSSTNSAQEKGSEKGLAADGDEDVLREDNYLTRYLKLLFADD